jgi:hypothetical protein
MNLSDQFWRRPFAAIDGMWRSQHHLSYRLSSLRIAACSHSRMLAFREVFGHYGLSGIAVACRSVRKASNTNTALRFLLGALVVSYSSLTCTSAVHVVWKTWSARLYSFAMSSPLLLAYLQDSEPRLLLQSSTTPISNLPQAEEVV